MSTDKQKYSIQNQAKVIAEYAERRGLIIVRSYEDEGRSGLRITGRDGLKDLIEQVRSGAADFDHILVYDVSRWGRFQDVDESAYYEFICRRAGIKLHYCADEFENDGSLASTILKNVKRLMAGEYSRQLSRRIFLSQCRMAESGLWRGGAAGYGLRRQLVDADGQPIRMLERGQRKSISTEGVVLRPGPASEIAVIRRIFNSFAVQEKSYTDIADSLNNDRIPNSRGAKWSSQLITKMLTNEAYIGNVIYNRTSFKLKEKVVVNPPSMWIRRDDAHEGLVPPEIYARAQQLIAKRREGPSDQDLLDKLAALWRREGKLSHRAVLAAPDVPYPGVYQKRFGSLRKAMELVGFEFKRSYRWVETDSAIDAIVASEIAGIIDHFKRLGCVASFDAKSRLLTIGPAHTIAIGAARCLCEVGRRKRWNVRVNRHVASNLTLIFKMDPGNSAVSEYCVMPSAGLAAAPPGRLRLSSPVFSKAIRSDSLEAFYAICAERIARSGSASYLPRSHESPRPSSHAAAADSAASNNPLQNEVRPRVALIERKYRKAPTNVP